MVAAASDVVPLLLAKKVDVATGVTNAEASEVRTVGHQKPFMLLAKDYGVPNSPIWLVGGEHELAPEEPAAREDVVQGHEARARLGDRESVRRREDVREGVSEGGELSRTRSTSGRRRSRCSSRRAATSTRTNAQWSELLPALEKQKLITKALPPIELLHERVLGGK